MITSQRAEIASRNQGQLGFLDSTWAVCHANASTDSRQAPVWCAISRARCLFFSVGCADPIRGLAWVRAT